MIQLTDKVFAIEVPEWASAFKIDQKPEIDFYELDCYEIGEYDEPVKEKSISIPGGNWRYICTSKEITEAEAKGIVLSSEWHFPERHTRYVDYAHPYDHENKQKWSEGFGTAKESLNSLLASKGLDVNKNYCLIEKM